MVIVHIRMHQRYDAMRCKSAAASSSSSFFLIVILFHLILLHFSSIQFIFRYYCFALFNLFFLPIFRSVFARIPNICMHDIYYESEIEWNGMTNKSIYIYKYIAYLG